MPKNDLTGQLCQKQSIKTILPESGLTGQFCQKRSKKTKFIRDGFERQCQETIRQIFSFRQSYENVILHKKMKLQYFEKMKLKYFDQTLHDLWFWHFWHFCRFKFLESFRFLKLKYFEKS